MAYQLSDIATRIQDRVRDASYPPTTIYGYINDTQNAVANEYDLMFWEATPQTYTLGVGVQDVTNGAGLPTGFIRPLNIRITTLGSVRTLVYIDYRDLEELHPNQENDSAGTPRFWTRYGNTVSVYPKPDQAYTVKMRWMRMPTQLSADADVPEIPFSFEELLIYGGGQRVFEDKDMESKADNFQNKVTLETTKLVNKYAIKDPYTVQIANQPRRRRHASSFSGS